MSNPSSRVLAARTRRAEPTRRCWGPTQQNVDVTGDATVSADS